MEARDSESFLQEVFMEWINELYDLALWYCIMCIPIAVMGMMEDFSNRRKAKNV